MLVHHADAGGQRVGRTGDPHRPALDEDLAGVRRIGTEQHVHQRRLASAVLAQQPEDLAGATLRSTASFALTAPKLLVMPRISMSGAGKGFSR